MSAAGANIYYLLFIMIIRNCHKKYNLCRNDAAASPFGKGCHEVAGYHTLLNPKCFSIGNYFIETYPQPLSERGG